LLDESVHSISLSVFGDVAVLKGAFLPFGIFLLATTVCLVFLPFAILIGYPWLIGIGFWYAGLWYAGRVVRPAQVAAVWVAYLGLILILHGILLGFDTALAGAPPTAEEKRFGRMVAYLGGAIAGVSVVAAYATEIWLRIVGEKPDKGFPLDDLAR
jgi:hypothetical protein